MTLAGSVPHKTFENLNTEERQLLKKMLNSERIKYLFGSYGVTVLKNATLYFSGCRISNLHSLKDDKKILRTLAIVDYNNPIHDLLRSAHERICEGYSIGSVLVEQGWKVHKKPVYFGEINISGELLTDMAEPQNTKAAFHLYELEVTKENVRQAISYCTIFEIHNPQYLSLQALQQLYEEDYPNHHTLNEMIAEKLSCIQSFLDAQFGPKPIPLTPAFQLKNESNMASLPAVEEDTKRRLVPS